MADNVKLVVSGIVAVMLITAWGLHASQLSGLATSSGSALSGVIGTAEKG